MSLFTHLFIYLTPISLHHYSMLTTSFVIPLEIQLSKTQQTEREIKKRLPMYHGKESKSRADEEKKEQPSFLHLQKVTNLKNYILNISFSILRTIFAIFDKPRSKFCWLEKKSIHNQPIRNKLQFSTNRSHFTSKVSSKN